MKVVTLRLFTAKQIFMEIQIIDNKAGHSTAFSNLEIATFLHHHLGEFGDPIDDILKSIDFIFTPNRGGNIFLATEDEKIVGAVVVNQTGMSGYIPENILVYIAVDASLRGKGIGKNLMEAVVASTKGAIALHCEPDNPAIRLYQRLGFSSKYLEMRLQNSN